MLSKSSLQLLHLCAMEVRWSQAQMDTNGVLNKFSQTHLDKITESGNMFSPFRLLLLLILSSASDFQDTTVSSLIMPQINQHKPLHTFIFY